MATPNIDWLKNVISLIVGFLLGLIADWVKTRRNRRAELKLAKREICDELAAVIVDLDRMVEGRTDFSTFKRVTRTPPKMDVINWYKKNRFDLLLQLDKEKGLRIRHERIETLERDPTDGRFKGQDVLLDELRRDDGTLDATYLQQRIRFAHSRLVRSTNNDRSS